MLLYRLAPTPEFPLLPLLPPPLPIANVNSLEASYIFLLQNSLYTRPHQSQDGRPVRLFHLVLWCWWFRRHATRPGPLPGSMWLNRPFLSGQPSILQVFVSQSLGWEIWNQADLSWNLTSVSCLEDRIKYLTSPANFLIAKKRTTSPTQVQP